MKQVHSKQVAMNRLGDIGVRDAETITEACGGDFLPHPFGRPASSPFNSSAEFAEYQRSVVDRFQHGDLKVFTEWFTTYPLADIWIDCLIISSSLHRIVAHRSGDDGFFATQRPDGDVINVFTVTAYDLGAAIAQAVPLTRPGQHTKLLKVAGPWTRSRPAARPVFDGGVSVRNVALTPVGAIPQGVIATTGMVQSRHQPAREWGFDPRAEVLEFVTFQDDGDYVVTSAGERDHWVPVTRKLLARRIDELIAADVQAIRRARGE